ncbi:MAG: formate dehydrogenase [Pseudolabrys sp.]
MERRRLLTGAGLASGAAGVTAVSAATPAAASEPQEPQHNGYRESEHVKTYYRLASF